MNLTDSPISSVTVNLKEYQSQGELISTTTSNSDGYYKFDNLPNQIYIIEAEDGTLLNRKTGKTNKSLPWAKEEYINLYLDK